MMRKFTVFAMLAAVLFVVAACVYDDVRWPGDGQFESSVPLDVAADLFGRMQGVWDADNGQLWGFHLQAPFIIADPITRHAVANMPDPQGHLSPRGGVYVGVLPGHVFISHTIADFAGLTWGMMAWEPGMDMMIEYDENAALRLLVHEAFHAVQTYRIVSGQWPQDADQSFDFINHSADARIAILMEANALAYAVQNSGEARYQAIRDALSIRAHRRSGHPEAAVSENAQEILEGLAIFTEILTFDSASDLASEYLYWVIGGAESTGLSIFPYFTGAAYAILLKEAGADWQRNITFETDLAALLQNSLNIETTPFDQLDLGRWGYYEIAPIQRAWVLEYQRMLAAAEDFVEQPWMLIPGDSFMDGAAALSIEAFFIPSEQGWPHLVFHGHFTYVSAHWLLHINGGFISPNWYPETGISVRRYDNIQISEDGRTATAPTWALEITNPAYGVHLDDLGYLVITYERR